MSMLYIVPTPIGNLSDMTFRAIEVLKEVDFILAEDTRTSGKLLKHYNITNEVRPFHSFNEHKVLETILDQIKDGKKVALISDAGTPAISDPGFLLVRACVQIGIKVSCLPGAVAFVPALVASGLPCNRFYYEGFLPHKKGKQTRLKYLSSLDDTFVLYESPHRLVKTLKELAEHCGDQRMACVAREISKMFEDIRTMSLSGLISHYSEQSSIKGEIAIVVGGKSNLEPSSEYEGTEE